MNKPNDGGPAFPESRWVPYGPNGSYFQHHTGMSLRDYFAGTVVVPESIEWLAEALMGEPPPQWSSKVDYEVSLKCALWWSAAEAKYRYMRADAMLAAREATR